MKSFFFFDCLKREWRYHTFNSFCIIGIHYRDSPVGKIAEKAVCRSVFSTKTYSFRLFFFGDFVHWECIIHFVLSLSIISNLSKIVEDFAKRRKKRFFFFFFFFTFVTKHPSFLFMYKNSAFQHWKRCLLFAVQIVHTLSFAGLSFGQTAHTLSPTQCLLEF